MIRRFNIWFDSLKEPKRFFLFVGMMLGWLLPLNAAEALTKEGIENPLVVFLRILGVVWLCVVSIIALSRLPTK